MILATAVQGLTTMLTLAASVGILGATWVWIDKHEDAPWFPRRVEVACIGTALSIAFAFAGAAMIDAWT